MCSHIEPIQTKAFQILKEMLWVSEFRKVSFLFIRSNLTIFMEIPAQHSVPSILRQKQMLMGWSSPCARDLQILRPKPLEKKVFAAREGLQYIALFSFEERGNWTMDQYGTVFGGAVSWKRPTSLFVIPKQLCVWEGVYLLCSPAHVPAWVTTWC